MEGEVWWALIEAARSAVGDRADDRDRPDDPLPGALTDQLAALEPREIAAFALWAIDRQDCAYRYPLWNAARLIEGGCGDDGFMDFRDGLILLGGDTFGAAVRDPDSLAALPIVGRMARGEGGWIGYQSLSAPIREAYLRVTGETHTLRSTLEATLIPAWFFFCTQKPAYDISACPGGWERCKRAGLVTASACGDSDTPDAAPGPTSGSAPAETPAGTPTEPSPSPEATVISRDVEGSEVRGGDDTVSVERGEEVTLRVTTDTADELHVHGYDLSADVAPGTPATLTFTADIPGVFEVELHGAHLLVVRIEVG